ncbi:hypothetical protein V8E53_000587 [Lactarius tabidus]
MLARARPGTFERKDPHHHFLSSPTRSPKFEAESPDIATTPHAHVHPHLPPPSTPKRDCRLFSLVNFFAYLSWSGVGWGVPSEDDGWESKRLEVEKKKKAQTWTVRRETHDRANLGNWEDQLEPRSPSPFTSLLRVPTLVPMPLFFREVAGIVGVPTEGQRRCSLEGRTHARGLPGAPVVGRQEACLQSNIDPVPNEHGRGECMYRQVKCDSVEGRVEVNPSPAIADVSYSRADLPPTCRPRLKYLKTATVRLLELVLNAGHLAGRPHAQELASRARKCDVYDTGNGQKNGDDLELLIRHVDTPAGREARSVASSEVLRFERVPPRIAEHGVLEWLTSPSWTTTDSSETSMRSDFLANSQSQLGVHHYGFEKVKHRLMEYLAVVRLRALIAQEAELRRPPVGERLHKIACALGRPLRPIALGGTRDEAEIRGHCRTVRRFDDSNDRRHGMLSSAKSNYHDGTSAALLEVLDPGQNVTFNGHHLNDSIDLSPNLFICAANSLDTISSRLVTIGILESLVKRSKDAGYNSVFVADELEKILALSRYDGGYSEREPRRGAVWGLDVTGMGKGAIMPVESIAVDISSSPVVKESAELTLSWVKTRSYDLGGHE